MGLFGTDQTVYLKYTIWLKDKARVLALQDSGTPGTQRVANMNPQRAAALYGAPIQTEAQPFVAPCIRSEFITSAAINYPYDLDSFDHDTGGWFGWLIGHTTHFIWRGYFALAAATVTTGLLPTPVAARHWIDGFSLGPGGGSAGGLGFPSRAGARDLAGYGMKFDNTVNMRSHTLAENGAAASRRQWERFYVRVRVFPVGAQSRLWRVHGVSSANSGVTLDILPDGTLTSSMVNSINTESLAQTGPKLTLNAWHKIDVVYSFFDPSPAAQPSGFLNVYVDGKPAMAPGDISFGGLSSNQNIGQSELGGGPANGLCWDADDWIGAERPTNNSDLVTVPPQAVIWWDPAGHPPSGPDWNNGSRVKQIGAEGFGSDNSGTWVGDWRLTRQYPVANGAPQFVTCAPAGARLTVATDAGRACDAELNSLGMVAICVAAYQKRVATDGALGFRLTGLTTVPAIVQSAALQWNRLLYSFTTFGPVESVASGGPLAGLELIHDSGGTESLQSLLAEVELIGLFGPEDIVTQPTEAVQPPITTPPPIGLHNAPYPHSPWARKGFSPLNPIVINGGTYVGNSTFQDLVFKVPIHLFWIRALGGGSVNSSVQWWSAINAAHSEGSESYLPETVIQALVDPAFVGGMSLNAEQQQTIVRLAGASPLSNLAGVTYQYIAVADPGERFFASGALKVTNQAIDIVNALDDGTFTPRGVLLEQERANTTTTVKLFYKGPGSAATGIVDTGAGADIVGLSVANGTLTSKAALANPNSQQFSYLAFRTDDGSADPGIPRVLQLATWVGDGAASRTVTLAPASGRRPLFALLVPHNGAPIFRDPSHAGTISTSFPAVAELTLGITGGGIDSVSVGSKGNQNGIVYDLFVIPGDSIAGNGGWSINGEFLPVEPTAGTGTQWDPTPASPEENAVPPDGTTGPPPPGGTGGPGPGPDLSGSCAVASLVPINQALSHIGVSIRVDDIVLEQTQAAVVARLHYQDDVDTTLRAFPWPFATRYADLVLVAGTATVPVNGDWRYAYRWPANCLFARRLLDPTGRGRAYDPAPIPFRVGSDDTGPLIYTNWINADGLTATLEYTIRPVCAASAGDALFRSALAWKLAHSFAPILAKDDKKAVLCWQMFKQITGTAQTVGSQEQQQNKGGGPDWLDGRDDGPDWLRGR